MRWNWGWGWIWTWVKDSAGNGTWGQGRGCNWIWGEDCGQSWAGELYASPLCFLPLPPPPRFLFPPELHQLLVHPGTPGHLDLGLGNDPTSGLLAHTAPCQAPDLPAGWPLHPPRLLSFFSPSEPPPFRLLIRIFKSIFLPRKSFDLSASKVFVELPSLSGAVPRALEGRGGRDSGAEVREGMQEIET